MIERKKSRRKKEEKEGVRERKREGTEGRKEGKETEQRERIWGFSDLFYDFPPQPLMLLDHGDKHLAPVMKNYLAL